MEQKDIMIRRRCDGTPTAIAKIMGLPPTALAKAPGGREGKASVTMNHQ
jgi:hypothetical protein